MKLIPMKYKDYVWPHNPRELSMTTLKNLKEMIIPFNGSIFQNFGREKRIVRGIGEFFGQDCIEQFNELFEVFKRKSSGFLSIPDVPPFWAEFKYLEMKVQTKPNVIEYSFEFWEDMNKTTENTFYLKDSHIVQSGETLWDIAYKYDVSIDSLLELNKNIKNPNDLSPYKVVILK